jgi:hypothetical protein
MMTRPITPDELPDTTLPDAVIDMVNSLIRKNWNGEQATIVISDNEELVRLREEIERVYRLFDWAIAYHPSNKDLDHPSTLVFSKRRDR